MDDPKIAIYEIFGEPESNIIAECEQCGHDIMEHKAVYECEQLGEMAFCSEECFENFLKELSVVKSFY